jgi:hypothetical protein
VTAFGLPLHGDPLAVVVYSKADSNQLSAWSVDYESQATQLNDLTLPVDRKTASVICNNFTLTGGNNISCLVQSIGSEEIQDLRLGVSPPTEQAGTTVNIIGSQVYKYFNGLLPI